jgi:hypothetical protein
MGDKQLSNPAGTGSYPAAWGINSCEFHTRNRELRGSLGNTQLSLPYQEQGVTRHLGEYTAVNSIPGTGSYQVAWGINSCQFHTRNRELPGWLGGKQLSISYEEQGATRLHGG